VDARPALADALGQYGSSLAGGGPSSQLAQGIIVELMRNEWLEHHIRHTLVPAYRARRELMIGAIEEHLVPLGVVLESQQPDVVGGFFLWLRMPQRGSSRRIHANSVERERLTICPGADCKVASDESFLTWDNYVRLSFSYETEENLVEGIARLARAIEASM
jgi:DNA-binding transcriptional MocR family regulator